MYEFFKSLHIIGFVSWFAALFYLPRLFIYHTEALDAPEPERSILTHQYALMERRLYHIIMTPAMLLTFSGGFAMLIMNTQYGMAWFNSNPWIYWKLGLIVFLTSYHHYSKTIMKRLGTGQRVMTSTQFRLYNEVTTLFLVAIVLLAVYKNSLQFLYALAGLIGLGVLLALGVRGYKKIRERSDGNV